MGHKISKEQIDPGVKDHIMSFVGDIADLETEVNTDIISAVNSLMVDRVDNAENMGKLANAIGEPVTANHSVDEVVEGLGEMLSTFKTNMMNSGVMVESSDKFKSLIDKIATLVDNEGKGIQIVEGTLANITTSTTFEETGDYLRINFDKILPFTPTYLIAGNFTLQSSGTTLYMVGQLSNVYSTGSTNRSFKIENITTTSFDITYTTTGTPSTFSIVHGYDLTYIAIGVGEEDTTLRDSLASILQEEGVSVTEEDDMASLISKVDSEFDRQVVPAGDAVATDVLEGKTFINDSGKLLTGTIKNNGAGGTVTPSTSNQTKAAGYYSSAITIKGDSNLKASNIVNGKTIFGVSGTALTVTPASSSTASKKLIDIYYLNETKRVGSTFDELNEMVVINRNELGFTGYSKLYAKMTGTIISTSPSSNSFYVRVLSSSWSLNESFNKNYVGALPIDIEFVLSSTDDITISGDSGSFADGLYLYIKDLKISIYYV